jgi:hypothetical protein
VLCVVVCCVACSVVCRGCVFFVLCCVLFRRLDLGPIFHHFGGVVYCVVMCVFGVVLCSVVSCVLLRCVFCVVSCYVVVCCVSCRVVLCCVVVYCVASGTLCTLLA